MKRPRQRGAKPEAKNRGMPDVAACMQGRCIGGLCPCLCHTSLRLEHPKPAMPSKRTRPTVRTRA